VGWVLALSSIAGLGHAQTPGWQPPVDANVTGCYQGVARAALMDDGTLLVACTGQPSNLEARYAALWMRTPEGRWQVAAQSPTRGSRATDLRKLSGSQALVSWTDYIEPPAFPFLRLQTWSVGTGVAPAFSIPPPPGLINHLPPLAETWGADELIARARPARKEDLPGAPDAAVGQAWTVEVVSRDGAVVATVPAPPNRFISAGLGGCVFPNGSRLLVFHSKLLSGATSNEPGKQAPILHAVVYQSAGGFGPTQDVLRTLVPWSLPLVYCAADGVARVIGRTGVDVVFSYADLAGERGWQPRQSLSSPGATVTPPAGEPTPNSVLMARSGDGRALLSWTDTLGNSLIPRVHALAQGERHFTADFSMPGYDPDATDNSTALTALAWNPSRQRFMGVLLRYPTSPAARRMSVEFDPAGAWSDPIPLPPAMLEGWQIDFNSSGRGVLLGRRNGQLLISDWR
jgi:hypothetical protein